MADILCAGGATFSSGVAVRHHRPGSGRSKKTTTPDPVTFIKGLV
jgi:hypothetical protein